MNAVPSRLPLRFGRACSKAAMVLVTLLLVGVSPAVQAQALSLINGESTQKVALGDLRDRADTAFTVFDPFQGRDVDMRGISFRDFLIEHFGEVPPTLHFTAWDDYEVSLGGWDDPSWYLVTIEDGEPLSLRSRGAHPASRAGVFWTRYRKLARLQRLDLDDSQHRGTVVTSPDPNKQQGLSVRWGGASAV